MGGIARRQERHLIGGGDGNYGCLGLVDLVLRTSLGDDAFDDIREEADEMKVASRAKGKAKGTRRRPRRQARLIEDES